MKGKYERRKHGKHGPLVTALAATSPRAGREAVGLWAGVFLGVWDCECVQVGKSHTQLRVIHRREKEGSSVHLVSSHLTSPIGCTRPPKGRWFLPDSSVVPSDAVGASEDTTCHPMVGPFIYTQNARVGMWGVRVLRPRAQSDGHHLESMARCDRGDGAVPDSGGLFRNKEDFKKL